MTTGKLTSHWALAALTTLVAACSSSTDSNPLNVQGVVQDLTLDPDGFTTVITIESTPAFITTANIQADGGQSAQTATLAGSQVTVTWDARVTPSHRVRVVSVPDVTTDWRLVSTSDDATPTFTITDGQQDVSDANLGGDTIEVTFVGPRVVESMAEDLSNWDLEVNGQSMDLTGSTFDLNPATQVLDITLGATANLHAAFNLSATNLTSVADVAVNTNQVAGIATGDAVAPTITSIEQNLTEDAYGRVVDIVFDEPMDPVFAAIPGSFAVNDHVDAIGSTLITNVETPTDSTMRLTFSRPVAPGLDQLDHSGLMDAHGNTIAGNTEAIGNAGAIANAFNTVTANTVEGGVDTVVITTTQALDPDFAEDDTRWTMTIDGGGVTMADQGLSYDLINRELTITLDSDMRNGDAVVVDAVGQVDVDGDTFTVTAGSVNAVGDASVPTFVSAVQNRTVDPSGYTVDITFSEAMHLTEGQDITNYTFSPAGTVVSATVTGAGNVVRVVTSDLVMTPVDVTVTIDSDVDDLAGNAMGAVSGPNAMTSSDVTAPAPSLVAGTAHEGADNDTIQVTFDDDMIEAEVENLANWTFEAPAGTPFTITGSSVDYNPASKTAMVTLDAGDQALKTYDDMSVAFVTMRDIGGNTVDAATLIGATSGESTLPYVHTVWRSDAPSDGTLEVRFSEPCDNLDDLFADPANLLGTKFAVRDNGGTLRGYPHTATILGGGLGVQLQYGFTIALTDTLDVLGAEDLAGNVMFPSMLTAIAGEDAGTPAQSGAPGITAIAGENNDTIVIDFNQDMSPWRVTDPDSYDIRTNPGGVQVVFGQGDMIWNGTNQLTITLTGPYGDSLQAAENYDVTLVRDPADPLRTDQGIELPADDTQTVAVSGDTTTGPTVVGSRALLDTTDPNAIIVIFDEAVDEASVETPANFDYDGGNIATAVSQLSARVVRAEFAVPIVAAQNLVIQQAACVDLAGNDAGANMTLAVTSDSSAPLLVSTSGTVSVGEGGDSFSITYNEQVDTVTALDVSNYSVSNGGVFDITGSALFWDSVSTTVTIDLPSHINIDATQALTITVAGVADAAGNVMPAPVGLAGTISGDAIAPMIESAFANRRVDPFGGVIDVKFDEDVDQAYIGNNLNWGTDGSSFVQSVTVMGSNHVRLTLDWPLLPGEKVELDAGLEDLAGNASGALDYAPIDPSE